jgi:hypothetical protein
VRTILSNPAYIGEAVSGRLQSRPSRRRRSALEPVGRGISAQATARDQWITVPVPAIVSPDVPAQRSDVWPPTSNWLVGTRSTRTYCAAWSAAPAAS